MIEGMIIHAVNRQGLFCPVDTGWLIGDPVSSAFYANTFMLEKLPGQKRVIIDRGKFTSDHKQPPSCPGLRLSQ